MDSPTEIEAEQTEPTKQTEQTGTRGVYTPRTPQGTPVSTDWHQQRLLTVEAAALRCGVTRQALYATWFPRGMPSLRLDGRRLVPEDDLEEWLAKLPSGWWHRGGRGR